MKQNSTLCFITSSDKYLVKLEVDFNDDAMEDLAGTTESSGGGHPNIKQENDESQLGMVCISMHVQ